MLLRMLRSRFVPSSAAPPCEALRTHRDRAIVDAMAAGPHRHARRRALRPGSRCRTRRRCEGRCRWPWPWPAGNGWCQRPAALDCHFESICDTCTHFATDATFQPVLLRQRDHAASNHQDGRTALFNELLDHVGHADTDSP